MAVPWYAAALRYMSGTWFVWNMVEVDEEEIRGSKVLVSAAYREGVYTYHEQYILVQYIDSHRSTGMSEDLCEGSRVQGSLRVTKSGHRRQANKEHWTSKVRGQMCKLDLKGGMKVGWGTGWGWGWDWDWDEMQYSMQSCPVLVVVLSVLDQFSAAPPAADNPCSFGCVSSPCKFLFTVHQFWFLSFALSQLPDFQLPACLPACVFLP